MQRLVGVFVLIAFLTPTIAWTAEPLRAKPLHRWSFDGSGDKEAKLTDSIGQQNGVLQVAKGESKLTGDGKLSLIAPGGAEAWAVLPGGLLPKSGDASVEVWFTPTGNRYGWNSLFRFDDDRGNNGDFFCYSFRTANVHRIEVADDGLNENIQHRRVPVRKDKPMHVVITYDEDGGSGGRPLVRWFLDSVLFAQKTFNRPLTNINDKRCILGPITGVYDEFRLYDYALNPEEIDGNYQAGPDKLDVTP